MSINLDYELVDKTLTDLNKKTKNVLIRCDKDIDNISINMAS